MRLHCPRCRTPLDVADDAPLHAAVCASCGEAIDLISQDTDTPALASEAIQPSTIPAENIPAPTTAQLDKPSSESARIDCYRIERVLGQGGFGRVYLAYDEQLQRHVAIKVPLAHRVAREEDARAYLAEARIVVRLKHPHLVPVLTAGSTPEFPCFVVSEYIEGATLADRLAHWRPSPAESAQLIATLAEALHYAHTQDVVHRDVKPGNILIDRQGKPYLVDFGLAIKDEDYGTGPKCLGTPAYMSPEQARGEAHRVDGRSDIFSLGVVLYELLTGRRPFRGKDRNELLTEIATGTPKPPRQINTAIPKELERICQKALESRATDRYSTAFDLADDLKRFLDPPPTTAQITPLAAEKVTPSNNDAPRIVPKGLRSFDQHDADFFLELLPGPRDRNGLPESIRFWKTRIEETDPSSTFSVGLLYGPSGCGKSSLVKAGLLPRLAEHVIPVYVEASATDTEARLLRTLRTKCPGLDEQLDLISTLAVLRCGQGIRRGKKVALVIDQFEQWLHAHRQNEGPELVAALRQCDGQHLQCIVMVRGDNFWTEATRFFDQLEVPQIQGQNSAVVDLFDRQHARKVLVAFGKAYGRIPSPLASGEANGQTDAFLDKAIADLADEGRIISVRLALFAEMMKDKPWTPAALRKVGGTIGLGATYLEEAFSNKTAPPEHRRHQQAARAVLAALMPEQGSDIKGQLRSHGELLAASGYAGRERDFEALLRILDQDTRLITPTDHSGSESQNDALAIPKSANDDPHSFYQLTHDYLVPSLRDWLTQKQRETRRGRAELRLDERAALWTARPESRALPAWWEDLLIRCLTQRLSWSTTERAMMSQSGRHHLRRLGIAAAVLVCVVFAGSEISKRNEASDLVTRLLESNIEKAPSVLGEISGLSGMQRWRVRGALEKWGHPAADESSLLRAKLALRRLDVEDVAFFCQQMPQLKRPEFDLILREISAAPATESVAILDYVLQQSREPRSATENEIEKGDREYRQAGAAAGLVRARDGGKAWPLLKHGSDLGVRSYLIERLAEICVDPDLIISRLETESDSQIRAAMIMGLGQFPLDELNQHTWVHRRLPTLYRDDVDPEVHSAAEWLLRQLGREKQIEEIDDELATGHVLGDRRWYVTKTDGVRLTMLVVPVGMFTMGSPPTEPGHYDDETLHQRRISRRIAVSNKEITFAQFRKRVTLPAKDQVSNLDLPQTAVRWYDAADFCRWLTKREGLDPDEQVFPPIAEDVILSPSGLTPLENHLARTGYRLPTEAEWEYVCRAGTSTRFFFGEEEKLMDRYGHPRQDEPQPVGQLKPNPWGFFDVHGNLWEWCLESYRPYPAAASPLQDREDMEVIMKDLPRSIRGGSYGDSVIRLRSACRMNISPESRENTVGFRVARTLPDEPW